MIFQLLQTIAARFRNAQQLILDYNQFVFDVVDYLDFETVEVIENELTIFANQHGFNVGELFDAANVAYRIWLAKNSLARLSK